ncbi:selenocysteine-specific translation elongation factor [Acetobacterium woodii]|uniref:Selenocysteine-specific elongation factor n=1 Tax=Acetobacterium woodii (strain ATCC 29683 / DSM 1030 / JCM 2381 / KCTC 1655 / WB1) TaxID=931626 RepID=H6LB57_ACEWD|nr:selenocysteine-specific translation elongation factor [Acetobacterium woodii]AFA47609.1 selenocysteine-specific translation elongation factor SelB [Acetobacterium woodii DSM 1030]
MNIILGTAGHIDHGKTSLVKALTGIDTDRLKEEKKRGITIELGFAHLDLPCGNRIGIVDVPGHEKFINNMLAGAGGIDLAMMVIAADEGIMPQTIEHFGILTLLEIKQGIIVITKKDLVDDDWIEMIEGEILEQFQESFLENAPIIAVSAHTGEGLDELKNVLLQIVAKVQDKKLNTPPRLPIDRVFSVDGFGTVVTGTLIEGRIKLGENISLFPSLETAKVRSLQVHGSAVTVAVAGQRVAVNLSGLKKSQVARGDTIAPLDSMENTMMIDVKLKSLKSARRVIKNASRVHFYHGTKEILAKVILLDRDELEPGQAAYAQLRFEETLALKTGDHFVVRFYSPLETVGGGLVLDANPVKHRRNQAAVIESMEIKENGTKKEKVLLAIREQSENLRNSDYIRDHIGKEAISNELNKLVEEKKIVQLRDSLYVSKEYLTVLKNRLLKILRAFHKTYPLKEGMNREELRGKLVRKAAANDVDSMFSYFIDKKVIRWEGEFICLPEFKVVYKEADTELLNEVENLYRSNGFAPPSLDDLAKHYGKNKQYTGAIAMLKKSGTIVSLDLKYFIHREYYQKALAMLNQYFQENTEIALGDYRDMLGVSRKYAVALLEEFDKKKITKKVGDTRRPFK